MKAEYQKRLVDSITMAASQLPESDAAEQMRAAIQAGAALICDHGILVPPWVPLDIITLRNHPHGVDGIPRDRIGDEFRPYDDWLRAFLAIQSARLGRISPPQRSPKLDCLAALARCWPAIVEPEIKSSTWKVFRGRTFAWIDAYRSLESRLSEMVRRWNGRRVLYAPGWESLSNALDRRRRLASLDGAMVDAFLQGKTNWPVHELFDAGAAHVYLSARDFELEVNRATRHTPQLCASRSEDPPELDSIEDPHHALGVWTLATLVQQRYGVFKLVNQSYPRLAGRPRSQPPRQVRVHLEWALSIESLERPIQLPASLHLPGTSPDLERSAGEVNISQASVLQAFAALLTDDWRDALGGVLAELVLRARRPEQDAWQVPTRGRRWKAIFLDGGLSPPAPFVQRLFRRTTTVELLTQPKRSRSDPVDIGNEWHCGCLLKDDLNDVSGAADEQGWTCAPERVEQNWNHVIVIDPQRLTGWITKTEQRSQYVHLRRVSTSRGDEDLSFLNLRRLATETMLDAVARRATRASL